MEKRRIKSNWPTATTKLIQTKKNFIPSKSFLNKFMNIGMIGLDQVPVFNVFVMLYLTWNCVEGKVSA